ncbi:MAG TPA: hypothetical protein VFC03_04820 [Acidimicrobiales bacterium]|nr:hypothetical protein [Acidimicrobiales bacterium]
MRAGEVRPLRVVAKNTGTSALASVPPFPVHLSHRWIDDTGDQIDGERTDLGRALLPGESASHGIDLHAPDVPGAHPLPVQLVQEDVFWFDELVAAANGLRLTVGVTYDEP